jgi:diacylglycerol kinase
MNSAIKFFKSFFYAAKGIVFAIIKERNLKVHLLAVIVVSVAGFYFHISQTEWIAVVLCFALVISLEMINTAIEMLADKISPDKDDIIGSIKDISAGAVFVAALCSVIIAIIVFGKYLWHYL